MPQSFCVLRFMRISLHRTIHIDGNNTHKHHSPCCSCFNTIFSFLFYYLNFLTNKFAQIRKNQNESRIDAIVADIQTQNVSQHFKNCALLFLCFRICVRYLFQSERDAKCKNYTTNVTISNSQLNRKSREKK